MGHAFELEVKRLPGHERLGRKWHLRGLTTPTEFISVGETLILFFSGGERGHKGNNKNINMTQTASEKLVIIKIK